MTAFLSDRSNAPTLLVAHASQAEAERVAYWLAANGWHTKAMVASDEAVEETLSGHYAALLMTVRDATDTARAELLRDAGYMRPIFALDSTRAAIPRCFDESYSLPVEKDSLLLALRTWLEDTEVQAELAADGEFHNSEVFARLRLSFLSGLADSVEAIEHAFAQKDWENAGHLVHALKGTAASFGFPSLAQSSREIETLLRTDRKPAAQVELKELRSQTIFLLG